MMIEYAAIERWKSTKVLSESRVSENMIRRIESIAVKFVRDVEMLAKGPIPEELVPKKIRIKVFLPKFDLMVGGDGLSRPVGLGYKGGRLFSFVGVWTDSPTIRASGEIV